MIQKVRGTRDILDTSFFNFAIDTIQKHIELYHYNQIELPIIESVDLFKRSLGTETDVVSKEMFVVSSSSKERSSRSQASPEGYAGQAAEDDMEKKEINNKKTTKDPQEETLGFVSRVQNWFADLWKSFTNLFSWTK